MTRPHYVEVNGITDTVHGHCTRFDICYDSLSSRLASGMTYQEAFTTPMKKNRKVIYKGRETGLKEALRRAGITSSTFYYRTKKMGLSDTEALEYDFAKQKALKLMIESEIQVMRQGTCSIATVSSLRKPSLTKAPRGYVSIRGITVVLARLQALDCFESHAIDIAQMKLFEDARSENAQLE